MIVLQFATDPLWFSRWELILRSIAFKILTLIWVKIQANQQLKTFTVVNCIFVIKCFLVVGREVGENP